MIKQDKRRQRRPRLGRQVIDVSDLGLLASVVAPPESVDTAEEQQDKNQERSFPTNVGNNNEGRHEGNDHSMLDDEDKKDAEDGQEEESNDDDDDVDDVDMRKSDDSNDDSNDDGSRDFLRPPKLFRNDPGLEEDWIMDTLDAEICRAEEDGLMESLDQDIGYAEEKELMHELLESIREAENLEYARSLPSKVKIVDEKEGSSRWTVTLSKKPSLPQNQVHRRKATDSAVSNVEEALLPLQTATIKQPLPKHASRDGNFEIASSVVLYSRERFQTCVIDRLERKCFPAKNRRIHNCNKSKRVGATQTISTSGWSVSLYDHPSNPHMYLLEATGPKNFLAALKIQVEEFIRHEVMSNKLRTLLNDDDSLVVDVVIALSKYAAGSLGATFREPPGYLKRASSDTTKEGVWIEKIRPGGQLDEALGRRCAHKSLGSALLAVDDQSVSSVSDVKRIVDNAVKRYKDARHARRKQYKKNLTFTLALSKYVDLEYGQKDLVRIPREKQRQVGDLNVRRRDGAEYDTEYYHELRLQRALDAIQTQKLPSLWVEYPEDDAPPPKALPTTIPRTKEECQEAYNLIMEDPMSVEVDVILLANEGLGGDAHSLEKGVFISNISSETSQLTSLLGQRATKRGMVLRCIDGHELDKPGEFEKSLAFQRESDRSRYGATLVLFDGTDLSEVNRSRLFRKPQPKSRTHGRNPRRRSGEAYPLHLYPRGVTPRDDALQPQLLDRDNQSRDDNGLALEKQVSKPARFERESSSEGTSRSEHDETSFPPPSAPACNNDDTPNSTVKKDGLDVYRQFQARYSELVRLDYKESKLDFRKVCSSMWKQHKVHLNGQPCHDHCSCIFVTDKMVKDVFNDNATTNPATHGVFEHYIPRFVHLLKKEYPTETVSKLLGRITFMWSLHQQDRMFGMDCGPNCTCEDEWDGQFGRGSSERVESFRASRKRQSSHSKNAPEPLEKKTKITAIPRKEQAEGTPVTIFPTNNRVGPTRSILPEQQDPGYPRLTTQRSGGRPIGPATFEGHFDTNQPLGAFFQTVTVAGQSRCRIFDINVNGQLAMYPNVVHRTSVAAVVKADKRIKISSHHNLKEMYDEAKKARRKLHLIFDNQGSVPTQPEKYNNWDPNGSWRGPQDLVGWAGGATQPPAPPADYKRDKGKNAFWKSQQVGQQPFSNHSPPLPVRGSPGNHIRGGSSTASTLERVVREGSFQDLLQFFESGIYREAHVLERGLKEEYEVCKREMGKTRGPKHDELERKKNLLKIYINGTLGIEKAMNLRHWASISIRIRRIEIDLNQFTVDQIMMGSELRASVAVRVAFADSGKKLEDLPLQLHQGLLSYHSMSGAKEYVLHNNAQSITEKRQLVIDIFRLATFSFRLNDLESFCSNDGSWYAVPQQVKANGSYSRAAMEIEVRRSSLDKNAVTKKKTEADSKLRESITIMKKNSCDISAIIRSLQGIDGSSMLHAALNLSDTSMDLIKQLLKLGADPNQSSAVESPLSMARRLVSRAEKKVEDLKRQSSPPQAQVKAQMLRSTRAQQVLKLLEDHVVKAQPQWKASSWTR